MTPSRNMEKVVAKRCQEAEQAYDTGITNALSKHPARVYEDKTTRTLTRVFTVAEFATVAESLGNQGESRIRRSDRDNWGTGGESLADCVRMARGEGWEGAGDDIAAINLSVEQLTDADVVKPAIEFRYDLSGGDVDVALFLSNVPENMVEAHFEPAPTRGKVVRLVVPICTSGTIDQTDMRRRGAAIVSLIDALIKAGYTLEIWSDLVIHARAARGRGKQARIAYTIKVKEAGEQYDPTIVAFGVGHPGMLRKLGFLVEEHENHDTLTAFSIGGSYGHYPFDARLEDLPEHAQHGPTIVLPMLDYKEKARYGTDEGIAEWINEMVERVKRGDLIESLADDDSVMED